MEEAPRWYGLYGEPDTLLGPLLGTSSLVDGSREWKM